MALEDNELAKSIQNSVENTITASNSILNNVQQQNVENSEARDNAAFVAQTANQNESGVGSEMQATDIINNNNAGGGGGATNPPSNNIDATALAYQEYLDTIGSEGAFDPNFYDKRNKGAGARRGKGDNIRVGQFTGKEIGSIPIFAAGGFVMPDLGLGERAANLAKAEAAKKKAQNEIAKYAHVDVPQQYQKGVTKKSFEILQNYMALTNNDLSILQNADNPLAIEFQKDRKALADLDLVMTEADRLQKTVLSPDKTRSILETSFIPTEVKEAANFIKKGSTDIDYLLTDEGQAELNEKMMMINLYDDRYTRLKNVKSNLDKDTETLFSNPSGVLNALDADAQASVADAIGKLNVKGTDKAAVMKVVHEFVPKEDIYRSVEEAYAGGNIYLDKDPLYSEADRKNMSASEIEEIDREYTINKGVLIVEDMLGDKVTANLQIFQKWQPRSGSGSVPKKAPTPFALYGNKFEKDLNTGFKGLQNIYGTMNSLDPSATNYSAKINTLTRSSVSSFANTMGGTAVQAGDLGGINTDGTMLMSKLQVQNNPIKSNEVNINDFRFGDQGLNANNFMNAVAQKTEGSLSPQEVKTIEFITGETYSSQKDLNAYISDGSLNNRLASATNDMNMGTTNHVATAYYGDQPWDNSIRVQIMNDAKADLLAKNANATEQEIATAQQSAVSSAMSQLHLVDRVYVTAQTQVPDGISIAEWEKIQDVPSYNDIFNDGTSAADIKAKEDAMDKLKQAVGDNVLQKLMGSKTKMGGFKSFNDPAYNGVKMFIPFDYNNANTSNQLDERFYKQGNVSLQGGKTYQTAEGSDTYSGETQTTSKL
jgi:hypothetical protein